jgi:phenylacetate-CoA ligase
MRRRQVSAPLRLGDVLASYPEFRFDLEEYIHSTKYRSWLDSRYKQFQAHLRNPRYVGVERRRIIAAVRKLLTEQVPAYKGLSNVAGLEEIPFIDKNSLRSDKSSFLNSLFEPSDLWCKNTSGTTGAPVTIFYSPHFYFEILHLSVRKAAATSGHREAERRPVFCMHVTDNLSCEEWVIADPLGQVGLMIQVVMDEGNLNSIERISRLIGDLQPAIITAKPSIFEVLVETLDGACRSNIQSPDCLISSGANLEESLREQVQEILQAPVYNAYGLTEFGIIASECWAQDGLHLDDTLVLCEVVDENGHGLPEGSEGELVLSSISNMAMPLIRYRTGDLVVLTSAPCACGRYGTRIRSLRGRTVLCFRFRSGALFSPTHFNNLFSLFPLREFQITQLDLDRFLVSVQLVDSRLDEDALLDHIKEYVSNALPDRVEVVAQSTEFDSRSKFERYRSQLGATR